MHPNWQAYLENHGAHIDKGLLLGFPEIQAKSLNHIMTDLSHLALIEISGDDAENFLHSQFTSDIKRLDRHYWQFSAWCNPKGKVKSTFFIFRNKDHFYLLLPATLVEYFLKQLQIFILRSKVILQAKSENLVRIGLRTSHISLLQELLGNLPQAGGNLTEQDGMLYLRISDESSEIGRFIIIGTAAKQIKLWGKLASYFTPVGLPYWELLDLKAGYVWLTENTSEQFLPQMLNIDMIGGLDYQKGCYPGQEVISRLHFRGRLKKRTHLAISISEDKIAIGDHLYKHNVSHSIGRIVNAQAYAGKTYLLAVIEENHIGDQVLLHGPDGMAITFLELPYRKPQTKPLT